MPPRLWAAAERARLCDLLDEVGPDAPTLCQGWRTSDLAAHLVVRENAPLAGAGIFVPALAGVTSRAMKRVLRRPFAAVVDRIRRGGLLPRQGRLGEMVHLLEFVVHREDVLRASPDRERMPDPEADDARDAAVFAQLRGSAGLLGRNLPAGVGLLVRSAYHGSIDVRRGPIVMVVEGDPVDLALWLHGRAAVSNVTIERHGGPDDLAARVESTLRR